MMNIPETKPAVKSASKPASGPASKPRAGWRRFLRDDRGGIAVYAAFFSMMAVGSGALVFDVGRMSVLRSQMQNRADAGVLAGSAQLDGRDGAQARATSVATNAMSQSSGIPGDSRTLSVQSVTFYSEILPARVAATGDEDSKFMEVVLEPRRVDLILEPILNPSASDHTRTLNSRSVAGINPFICHAPPLMVCNPGELNPLDDLLIGDNAGRQIQLKPPPGGGSWSSGNYGLLALPDGSIGANDTEAALAAIEPQDCYTLDVTTATGVRTNKVQNGVNARFDIPGGLPYPAPNVIAYPKDAEIVGDTSVAIGSGNWDIDGYWAAKHGGALPGDLAGATRYQLYLYEQGEAFAREGRQTHYPIDGDVPDGYVVVTPAGPSIPEDASNPHDPNFDGVPSQAIATNGYKRRLLEVAVLQCQAEGVRGSHEYPSNGQYLEMFITEPVADEPAGGIYAEIVRPLTTTNDPDFHANVKLYQ